MSRKIKAAIVQDVPVPLAVDESIERAIRLTKEAIETGARVIAFGEGFLGGHPAWLEHVPAPALWDHPGTKELHAMLLRQAVRGNDPRFAALQWAVDIAGVVVSAGGFERVRNSLFSTQFLFRPKAPPLLHRKLVHTPGERMLLGSGDGSTLEVHQAHWGRVGQLASAEHWMPLVRAAMDHAGEEIHVAAWPTVHDISLLASAHYAYEARAFVLAAGTIQYKQDYLAGYARAGGDAGPGRALLNMLPEGRLQSGRSAVIAPDGVAIAQADSEPRMLIAELDLAEIDAGLTTMNIDGHHARPDIFELSVDRRPRTGIVDVAEDPGEPGAAAAA
ncbi:nitrilase-related carbon-nitrogen hydrolase [Sphingomonas canadensis]|uniref:Nitrilase-related carbon-nitrogen hydrolase n=1 Tax=Sphingomonas canadensis TaxID=1219257 RepID=A0ABW3H3R6_9SPHN|nr:nitrilase-related carbon-nitrogen hydrolase [Sphingomonas canadensis]MCW3835120.1 carbon-nitrogen hydrolase family protein [Sphingomonas canadensis]